MLLPKNSHLFKLDRRGRRSLHFYAVECAMYAKTFFMKAFGATFFQKGSKKSLTPANYKLTINLNTGSGEEELRDSVGGQTDNVKIAAVDFRYVL